MQNATSNKSILTVKLDTNKPLDLFKIGAFEAKALLDKNLIQLILTPAFGIRSTECKYIIWYQYSMI